MKHKVLNIISGILGAMIVVLFVLNTYQTLTRETSEDALIQEQVDAIKKALCGELPLEKCNLAEAIRQINTNSDQNLLLTCKLFKQGGQDSLTRAETKSIEKICKQELERQAQASTSSQPSSSDSGNNSNAPSSSPSRRPPNRPPRSNPPPPPPEEEPEPLLCVTELCLL